MALLILCAPVCATSSRFSQSSMPQRSPRFRACVRGVGRPTKSERKLTSKLSLEAGSASASRIADSGPVMAGTKVSGTYRPPKDRSVRLSRDSGHRSASGQLVRTHCSLSHSDAPRRTLRPSQLQ